jgi:hypothetical protein
MWSGFRIGESPIIVRCNRARRETQLEELLPSSCQSATYLVVDLLGGVLELDGLQEKRAFLLELDALGPVVEGSGYVDLFGRVLPGKTDRVSVKLRLQLG